MTPTGLRKTTENVRFKHLRGQKDNEEGNSYEAISALTSLSDLTALWPYLHDQQRDTVLDVAQALAKSNTSTVNGCAGKPVKQR